MKYSLFAVIIYSDFHFYSYVRDDDKWCLFDDSTVERNRDITGLPNLLFYTKCN